MGKEEEVCPLGVERSLPKTGPSSPVCLGHRRDSRLLLRVAHKPAFLGLCPGRKAPSDKKSLLTAHPV